MSSDKSQYTYADDGKGLVSILATCEGGVSEIYRCMQTWRDAYSDRFSRCVSVSVTAVYDRDLGGISYNAIVVYRPDVS